MAVARCVIKKKVNDIPLTDTLFAAKVLNGMAYKLYIYFASFQEEETMYEKKNFIQTISTTDKSVNKAFDELIDKKFLIQENELTYFFSPMGENTINKSQDDNLYNESMKVL